MGPEEDVDYEALSRASDVHRKKMGYGEDHLVF